MVPYLAALGITDLYLSPPFQAARGSQHGYDVVDPNRLRDELGGDEGYEILCQALARHGLGQIVDFVPNHMGIGPENPWWMDVLENGPSSQYAPYFDVDWSPLKHELENKVLVPVLGDQFGAVLERGELRLERDGGAFQLAYFEHRFPIAPRAVPRILTHRLDSLAARLGEEDVQLQELRSIVSALEKLAPRTEVDPEKVAERAREKEVAKRRLAALFEASPQIRERVDENVRLMNGTPGDPKSFDALAELLDHQAYRLAHWRVAGEEINYRRFFDVSSLAAIRVEDPRVFDEVHRLIFRLVKEGKVTGLRIDHPDGLYTPSAYFRRLHARLDGIYLVVEKILEGPERMPDSWRVDGTTGYEFLSGSGGLYVASENARAFDDLYARFIGRRIEWQPLVEETKRALMSSTMASEMHLLGHRLNRLSEHDRRTRDFTLSSLSRALVEYVARLPIYRTYVEGTRPDEVEERDRRYIEATLARARRSSRHLDKTIYDFLRDVLLLRRPESVELVRKLQQVTGPVAAKAVEDTACYVYQRLVSLNEVGGDPVEFGRSPERFHTLCQERLKRWPGSLNATSTHDTKRSEDVRLRISALSEIPVEWEARLARFAQLGLPHKREVDGALAPDANDELFIYQTLLGIFPDDGKITDELTARLSAYLEKALREAKVHSSWTNPDEAYERAAIDFACALLASRPFLDDFLPLERRLAHAARLSSLSQLALKLAAPGVTDLYQGCELWDLAGRSRQPPAGRLRPARPPARRAR